MSVEVKRRKSLTDIAVENEHYLSDFAYTTGFLQRLLTIIGIWALVKISPKKKEILFAIIFIAISLLLIVFLMIPMVLHLVYTKQNLKGKMKLFGPILLRVANLTKFYWMIYRRKSIRYCLEHVRDDWKMATGPSDREIMRKSSSNGRQMVILCIFFMYTAGIFYQAVLPLMRGKKINALNQTIRPFAYQIYDRYPAAQRSPNYEIIFYTTIVSAFVTYTTIISSCSLAATFVWHACGQIDVIMNRLQTMFDNLDGDVELLNTRVSVVVKYHVRLLRLADTIDNALSEICLTEVVSSTFFFCSLGWRLTHQLRAHDYVAIVTYGVYIVTITYNLFIFCYIGEILKGQCAQIGENTYLSDWWKMPGKTGQAMVLVIAMASIPRGLTAGGIMELSVTNFVSIIKTSVAYIRLIMSRDWTS
ncbi:odorant receptor 2a-like [Venturia canescens]|uniref:odorant receptor 2a-like n=1 Tax=Venturia canescens TaxID=32260 RepID=UPI001C9C87DD|nr:odorant receptor 2a-like [Venturia canescens]